MKLKFDSNLKYQTDAIKAVTDLFKGQSALNSYFNINGQTGFDYINSNEGNFEQKFGQGVGNKLTITNNNILDNLREVQNLHKIAQSESLSGRDFNIEMETGTGKTYVYLKTIFELNKLYGFTKFIIVVPSIAIKEGVYKTVQITKEHFKGLYDNIIYDYFVYDSSKLEQVRNFATSSNIQIMIINIDAFNKSFTPANFDESKKTNNTNIIHREQDKLSGYKPIDLIAETNPIVIIDEPQSVMGTKGETAVASLNPLCTLRYSATHKEIQNLIYSLDAIDAYEMNLVKGIEVASFESANHHNDAYIKLVESKNIRGSIRAKLELDVKEKGTVKRKIVSVKKGDYLEDITNREIYGGYTVADIGCEKGNEWIEFSPKDLRLKLNESVGDVDDLVIKRAQIRKTIEEHLNKELKLNKKGIKVLSLFFIDKVANYRVYDDDGNPQKGKYAEIFEEEYNKLIKREKYQSLDLVPAEEVHNGYFAMDKKGKVKDFKRKKNGEFTLTKDADDTFNLIMKDKERLLSFDSNLKFIFSHSALKEGWDNPNVFQICTLNETKSTMKKRQEIGRGLRLCVNQDGERMHDKSINTLTVMANESYEDFAKSLQSEIEKDTGIKFAIVEKTAFSHLTMKNKKGDVKQIGKQGSMDIFNHFKKMNYINGKGKVQDALKVAIRDENVDVPERYSSIKDQIVEVVAKSTKKLDIKDANRKRKVKVNKKVYLSDDFKEFWDKIKHKTTYSVDFDTDELIKNCSKALTDELEVNEPKLIYTKSGLAIDASGVSVLDDGMISSSELDMAEEEVVLPDIITYLQNETFLTRGTIVDVLIKSGTLEKFKKNPQQYMENALKIIRREMNHMLIDGIKYTEIDDYYKQELFEEDELFGYLEKNMVESENSVYDYVIFDSDVERNFALKLENDPDVKLYTKLPGWFKINTPIGGYNPDWAVLLEENGQKNMYFIVETKGNVDIANIDRSLKRSEQDKIKCGKKHFKALGDDITFKVASDYRKFKA